MLTRTALASQTFGPAALQGNLAGRFVHLAGAPPWQAAPARRALPPTRTTEDTLVSTVGPRVVRTRIPATVAHQTRAADRHRTAVRALIDAGLSRPGGVAALPAESPAGVSSGRLERAAFVASETHLRTHRAEVLNAPASFAAGGWPTAVAHAAERRAILAEVAALAETPRTVSARERKREHDTRKRRALAAAPDTNTSAAFAELAALRAAAARAAGGAHEISLDARRAPRPDASALAYTEPALA